MKTLAIEWERIFSINATNLLAMALKKTTKMTNIFFCSILLNVIIPSYIYRCEDASIAFTDFKYCRSSCWAQHIAFTCRFSFIYHFRLPSSASFSVRRLQSPCFFFFSFSLTTAHSVPSSFACLFVRWKTTYCFDFIISTRVFILSHPLG